MSESLLGPLQQRHAAFQFLACSTIGRYHRVAKSLAEESGINDRLSTGLLTTDRILERAKGLWHYVLRSEQRGAEEFELAILLAVLSRTAHQVVSDLLQQIALCDKAGAAWVSALSRKLLSEKAASTTIAGGEERRSIHRITTDSVGGDELIGEPV